MANVLTDQKLVPLSLLKGKYTTDLKAWVSKQIGAEGLRTVAVDETNNKILFYKEDSASVIVGTTSPAFSFDFSKAARTGAAADVSIADAGSLITATTVEGALQELASAIAAIDVEGDIEDAIAELKNEDAAVAHQFVTAAVQADGVVTVSRAALTADDIPSLTLAKISDAGTAAGEDVATSEIADDTTDTSLVTSAQVAKYVKDKTASVVGALHFKGIKTSTSEVTDPKEGDVVIVGTTEYIYDGSKWAELGDEGNYVPKTRTVAGIDLVDDVTKTELLTALGVEDGADVNVIEEVQVNGTALTPDGDKAVNITIAEGSANGKISVNGTDVAVKGLDTMAYESADDYVLYADIVLAADTDIADLFPTT